MKTSTKCQSNPSPLRDKEIMTEVNFTYNALSYPSLHGLARRILASERITSSTDEQVSEKVLWYIQWKCHQDAPVAKAKPVSKPVGSKRPVELATLIKVLRVLKEAYPDIWEEALKEVR